MCVLATGVLPHADFATGAAEGDTLSPHAPSSAVTASRPASASGRNAKPGMSVSMKVTEGTRARAGERGSWVSAMPRR